MTIPTSGPVSFNTLKNEYNDTNPVRLNEFYRGGLVPDSAINNGSVPTSGEISISDLRGSSNEFVAVVSSSTTQLNLQTLFSGSAWSSSVPKRVEINSGVVIGSSSISTPALTVGSGAGGVVRINNAGSIQGAGGSANSGNGGPAVRANSPTQIQNTGQIYAGGGGGGRGGTGGSGSCSPNPPTPGSCPCGPANLRCDGGSCPCGSGTTNSGCQCSAAAPNPQVCRLVSCRQSPCPSNPGSSNPPVSGGVGGSGGRGRGYTQSNLDGVTGSLGPDCSGPSGRTGGRGGQGGFGGNWGATGEQGDTGLNGNLSGGSAGTPGGSAGNYIINDSNVTWIGGRGTVAGGVA